MIEYLVGDATDPQVEGCRIIAHVCNDVGGWGRGFVLSISKRYPMVEQAYRDWHSGNPNPDRTRVNPPFRLGEVQLVKVSENVYFANMVAQHDVQPDENGIPPIRYDALEVCMRKVRTCARILRASVHMPRIGCGLAGGKWSEIEPIVNRALANNGVKTYVYDFETGDKRTIPWKP